MAALRATQKLNLWLAQWFCAYPVFAETRAYRRYHLKHHAHTQQDDDPDLVLSAPFPITRASYRRKFLRDITGQTGYQQRKAQFVNALGRPEWPFAQRAKHFWSKLGPQFVTNAVLFAALRRRRRVVGLSAAVAAAVADLADGHHAHPQHRRACSRARQRRSAAQYAHDARELSRAAVHRAVLRQLSPRASSAVVRALLQSAARAQHPSAQVRMPRAWRCSRAMPQCCGWRCRSRTARIGRATSPATRAAPRRA